MTALLNQQDDAAGCKIMLKMVEDRLARAEHVLTHSVLDRDKYMLQISEATVLRAVRDDLAATYRKIFQP